MRAARSAFTRRPYHAVKLDEIAASAHVGKGTIYIYFESKEQLYLEMVTEGLDELLVEVRRLADACDHEGAIAWNSLCECIRHICGWTLKHPRLFDIMRSGVLPGGTSEVRKRRADLGKQLERIVMCAAEAGEIDDPRPRLTAQFIPSMARSAVVWGSGELSADQVSDHVIFLLDRGVRRAKKR